MKELEPKIQARPLNEFQNNSDEEVIMYTYPQVYGGDSDCIFH
jgi:hypothetical protein